MYNPKIIYYEKAIKSYELGIKLLSNHDSLKQISLHQNAHVDTLNPLTFNDIHSISESIFLGIRRKTKIIKSSLLPYFIAPYTSSRVLH